MLQSKDQGNGQTINSSPNMNDDPSFSLARSQSTHSRASEFLPVRGNSSSSSDNGNSFMEGQYNSASVPQGSTSTPGQSYSYITEVRSPHSGGLATSTSPPTGHEMIWPNWPRNVPTPELLRHLWVLYDRIYIQFYKLIHIP